VKIFVWTEDEGYFHACELSNRKTIWAAIHDYDGGDAWANRDDDFDNNYPDDLDYQSLSEEDWMKFVHSFEQPARIAVVDLEVSNG
jgi:hypothetical protein